MVRCKHQGVSVVGVMLIVGLSVGCGASEEANVDLPAVPGSGGFNTADAGFGAIDDGAPTTESEDATSTPDAAGPEACTPSCESKSCGDDGCEGSCGLCASGEVCSATGQCEPEAVPCSPSCAGKMCGDDGCGGSCGSCPSGQICNSADQCQVGACEPQCGGKECGDNGCGGSCGECLGESFCNAAGICESGSCTPSCVGKNCGSDGCGGSCGVCAAGQVCNIGGQCEAPAYVPGGLGSYCGPTESCAPQLPDPVTGELVENTAYPDCLNEQCDSNYCIGAGLPGVFLIMPACSQSCTIYTDAVNNATGLPGADGVEDEGAISDCAGFNSGPGGANWRCVNFGTPGLPGNSFCMPGSSFEVCGGDMACPAGEGCNVTTFGGLGTRCFAEVQGGQWGDAVPMTAQCNDDPYQGDNALCEQGLCYTTLGCASFCETTFDCDTTQIYGNEGCDTATNTCKGWPSKNCLTDVDCSAWYCNDPAPLFSSVPEFTPQVCFPNICNTADDCPESFYCRYFFNGAETADQAAWEHRCLADNQDGVEIGEACDADPTDNIPGNVCKSEDLCIGGFCSAVCEDESQCAPDGSQVCQAEVVDFDPDADTVTDFKLPLEYCVTFEGKGATCLSEATCPVGQRCRPYLNTMEADDGLSINGACADSEPAWGSWGQTCGSVALGAQVETCESFCLGADEASGTIGFCSNLCESHTDCPATTISGQSYTGRCRTYLYENGLDDTLESSVYISLCVPNPVGSSGEPCDAALNCALPNEACTATTVNYGPDYVGKTEHICVDKTSGGVVTPTRGLGEACDPIAANDECKTAYCLADATGVSGVCTKPCLPEADSCDPTGTNGLVCTESFPQPRAGAYAQNAASVWMCEPSN